MEKIIAVDFDGTLCRSKYPECGEPNLQVIHRLKAEQASGATIILWTCRAGEPLENAVKWCEQFGLKFDYINENAKCKIEQFQNDCRKVFADEYWDDKAVNPLKRSSITVL